MYLRLGQLVYTSFAGMGFSTLASAKVPQSIQQAFTQRVSQYWDAYAPPQAEYRAVYIQQLAPDQILFGWLYNDGTDDIGRSNVPYFLCYYMTAPLFDFQLANIFTCLHKGPLVLLDRHSFTPSIETNILPDLWSYQPVRPGVALPANVRQRSYKALQQGEMLDVFVPIDAPGVIEQLKWHNKQQTANFLVYTHWVIEGIGAGAAITKEPATGVTQSQDDQQKLYQRQAGSQNPLFGDLTGMISRRRLRHLPLGLSLSNQHTEPVKAWLARYAKALPQQASPVQTLNPDIPNGDRVAVAYKNAQLLLTIAIAAVALALATAIYGIFYPKLLRSDNSQTSYQTSRSVPDKTFAEVPNVPQGLFNYGGSTSFAPLRSQAVVTAINQAHPQFQLRYTPPTGKQPGSSIGIQMLLAGQLSFAQSSRPLKASEIAQAKQRGFDLEQIPVALDAIAFYVNPQLSIPGLSLSQVKDIFTGKVTNWKALGGPNLPITPFSRNSEVSGTVEFLQTQVLAGANFSSTTITVSNVTESIRKVAVTPGGISYATASEVVGQKTIKVLPLSVANPDSDTQTFVLPSADANATGSYPLTRPLFVIVNRNSDIDARAGDAYVKLLSAAEGQRFLEQAGFIPIRQ